MNDSVLRTLLKILAYLSLLHKGSTRRDWMETLLLYLKKYPVSQSSAEVTTMYEQALEEAKQLKNSGASLPDKQTETLLCNEVENNLLDHEKILLYIMLVEFIDAYTAGDKNILNTLNALTATCSVSGSNALQLQKFIRIRQPEKLKEISDLIITGEIKDDTTQELEGAWIEENRPKDLARANILKVDALSGEMFLVYERNINAILFKYMGNHSLTLNMQPIENNQIYIFKNKDKILINKRLLFSYKEVSEYFIRTTQDRINVFYGTEVSIKSQKTGYTLQPFSFSERSGSIVGILGDKNSGKEALADLLSGQKKPSTGSIAINGFDIFKNKHKLLGLVANIPKDPVLIEGLTIFENYYYYAQLYYRYLDKKAISEKIFTILNKLGLQNLKSLKWQPDETNDLSGLQIKLLNLGIGLLKEPAVLILEEPFKDLNTLDIQELFSHFRELSMKGKLVFISSTPPYLFNLREYDKLWIFDQGGYPIYNGKPENAISYFQSLSENLPSNQSGPYPAEIWQIIKANITDMHGEKTRERKIKSAQWYDFYKQNIQKQIRYFEYKNILPHNSVRIPDIDKQFIIHFVKDFFLFTRKFAEKSSSLLFVALTGFLLGILFRHSPGDSYSFSRNPALIDFFTLTSIGAFTLGVFRGKSALKYDKLSFQSIHGLELNTAAFYTPKLILEGSWTILLLVIFTGIPYIIINNTGLFLSHLLIYILIAYAGVITGAILAAIDNKHIAYGIILIVVVFQFFVGTHIFINQQTSYSNQKKNPVTEIASFSFMRWSQEALSVDQMVRNRYSRIFFTHEKKQVLSELYTNTLMPLLISQLDSATNALYSGTDIAKAQAHFSILTNELSEITRRFDVFPFEYIDALNTIGFSDEIASECRDYLTYLQFHFYEMGLSQKERIASIKDSLNSIHGSAYVTNLKNSTFNYPLFNIINQPEMKENISVSDMNYCFNNYPVYRKSLKEFGKAHFFSVTKLFNNQYISTYWFNVVMLILGIFILYSLIMAEVPYYLSKRFR